MFLTDWVDVVDGVVYFGGAVVVAFDAIKCARDGTHPITPLRLLAATVLWPVISVRRCLSDMWRWATTPIGPREKPEADRAVGQTTENPT